MRVLKVEGGKREYVEDAVVEDIVFQININGRLVASVNTLNERLVELVYGFLCTMGYINELDQVEEMTIEDNVANVKLDVDIDVLRYRYFEKLKAATLAPSRFVIKESSVNLTSGLIHRIMDELDGAGSIFKQTGGTHSALLYGEDEVVSFAEDVGRFNALDKVIGDAVLRKVYLKETILATSGRLAGEMVLKASNAGIPVMCSVSAPIASGVNIAKVSGMTLIGFARGDRFNVYSGFHRLT